jgi:hypothetical protein
VGEVIVRAFDDLVEAKEIVLPNGLQAVKIDVERAVGLSRCCPFADVES